MPLGRTDKPGSNCGCGGSSSPSPPVLASRKTIPTAQRLPTGEDLGHRWQMAKTSASNPKHVRIEKNCDVCHCRSFANKTSCRSCGASLDAVYTLLPNQWPPLGVPPQVLNLYDSASKPSSHEQPASTPAQTATVPQDVDMSRNVQPTPVRLRPLVHFPMPSSSRNLPSWKSHCRTHCLPRKEVSSDKPSVRISTTFGQSLLPGALQCWSTTGPGTLAREGHTAGTQGCRKACCGPRAVTPVGSRYLGPGPPGRGTGNCRNCKTVCSRKSSHHSLLPATHCPGSYIGHLVHVTPSGHWARPGCPHVSSWELPRSRRHRPSPCPSQPLPWSQAHSLSRSRMSCCFSHSRSFHLGPLASNRRVLQ